MSPKGFEPTGDAPDTRLSGKPGKSAESSDLRTAYQRDRDRVLYSAAFQRLGTTTQVGTHSTAHVFHTRYSHSIKVAQVARRAAERWNQGDWQVPRDVLDPDVVETAALAHDLGHPPFGHLGEEVLREFTEVHVHPGFPGWLFEGNAQSFRVATTLALATDGECGLDLTLRSLRATLKYPKPWAAGAKKWGFYPSEDGDARRTMSLPNSAGALEAQIMDWADDVTYALHDFQDFFRAGLIQIGELLSDPIAALALVDHLGDTTKPSHEPGLAAKVHFSVPAEEPDADPTVFTGQQVLDSEAIRRNIVETGRVQSILLGRLQELPKRFRGSTDDRVALRKWAGNLISAWQSAAFPVHQDGAWTLERNADADLERAFLKQLLWFYVIDQPGLRHQQAGQRHMLTTVLGHFLEAAGIVPEDGWLPRSPLDKTESAGRGWVYSQKAEILARFPEAQRELLRQLRTETALKPRVRQTVADALNIEENELDPDLIYRYLAPEAVVDLVASLPEPAVSQIYETLRCGRIGDLRDQGVY